MIVIVVFFRSSLCKLSYSQYSQAKAVVDILFLEINVRNFTKYILEVNLPDLFNFFCVYSHFGDAWTGTASQCFLLLISIDRLFIIVYPNRFHIFKNTWIHLILILIATIYSLLLNILLPINQSMVESRVGNATTRSCYIPRDVMEKQSWILAANVPVIILNINSLINIKLLLFIRKSRTLIASKTTQHRSRKKDIKFAIVSIGQGVIGFLCKTGSGMIMLYANLFVDFTSDLYAMLYALATTIYVVDSSSPFLVHFFINTVFYMELLVLISFGRKNQSTISSTNSNAKVGVAKKI